MVTVRLGSKGEDVKILQKYLGLNPDGSFGPNTDKKVKEWQKSKGLVADGIIGPKSWAIILNDQNKSTAVVSNNTTNTSNEKDIIGLSNGIINKICLWETGHKFGYTMQYKDLNGYDLKDAKGHKTYGYGLLYHPVSQKFMDTIKKVWTQKELEELFLIHAKQTANKIDKWASVNKVKLLQRQKDAIASGCYNFGMGFLIKQICKMIIKNPNDPKIRSTWEHLSDIQGKKYPGLITRRKEEARWYFEGK